MVRALKGLPTLAASVARMADRQLAPGGGDSGSGTEYTDEEYTDDDLIDRILENYTTRLEPELRFKLRHRFL